MFISHNNKANNQGNNHYGKKSFISGRFPRLHINIHLLVSTF